MSDEEPGVQPDATEIVALEAQQARALELTLEGHSAEEIAATIGVHRSTVWRWRTDIAFAAQLMRIQEQRSNEASSRLGSLAHDAVSYLGSVLKSEAEPTALRIKAAESILNRSGHGTDSTTKERLSNSAESYVCGVIELVLDRFPDARDDVLELLKETVIGPTEMKPQGELTIRLKGQIK